MERMKAVAVMEERNATAEPSPGASGANSISAQAANASARAARLSRGPNSQLAGIDNCSKKEGHVAETLSYLLILYTYFDTSLS